MSTTPQELFNQRVPKGLTEDPQRARDLALIIQFNVTGSEGGCWTVDTVADPPNCTPGTREDVQCTISISHDALVELIESDHVARPQVFMKHILEGTVEVEGDATQAMKLSKIFAIGDQAT